MNNTIAAVSTAYGEGGIGIVRISGDHAREILQAMFRHGKRRNAESATLSDGAEFVFQDRKMYYGHIIEPSSGKIIDEALVVCMRAPRTYTGEDVAEIHCHGSVVSLRRILEKTFECGAMSAAPGEFTKRAFLNGRIDLARANAVIDIIKAKTERGHEAALGQLAGGLSGRVNEIRDSLADVLAEAVVNMDYPDEGASEADNAALRSIETKLTETKQSLDALLATAETGRMIMEGLRTVIIGKPNAGKSSLLNALLRESRAIVSDMPGTTRDSIDEYLNIRGIPVKLTDTAGLRDAETTVEALGIEKSKAALHKADLILLTLDGSCALDAEDRNIADTLRPGRDAGDSDGTSFFKSMLAVINKSDLPRAITAEEVARLLPGVPTVDVSAMTGEGIADIEAYIVSAVYGGKVKQEESVLVTDAAHKALLLRAAAETQRAIDLLKTGEALDFVETDIRDAYDTLGVITGQTVTEDILDRVFSKFCVGK